MAERIGFKSKMRSSCGMGRLFAFKKLKWSILGEHRLGASRDIGLLIGWFWNQKVL